MCCSPDGRKALSELTPHGRWVTVAAVYAESNEYHALKDYSHYGSYVTRHADYHQKDGCVYINVFCSDFCYHMTTKFNKGKTQNFPMDTVQDIVDLLQKASTRKKPRFSVDCRRVC